jgi:hypothetical protein
MDVSIEHTAYIFRPEDSPKQAAYRASEIDYYIEDSYVGFEVALAVTMKSTMF